MKPILVDISHSLISSEQLMRLATAIWRDPVAARRAGESAVRYWRGQAASKGPFYLIRDANGRDLGLIGAFWHADKSPVVGLRWSGVIPDCRSQGVYRAAISSLVEILQSLCPNGQWLEEMVPPGRSDVIPVFESLGFEDWGMIRGDDPHFERGTRMRLPINGTPLRYYEVGKGSVDRYEVIHPRHA